MATNIANRGTTTSSISVRAWYSGTLEAYSCDFYCNGSYFASDYFGAGSTVNNKNWTTKDVTKTKLSSGTSYSFRAIFYTRSGTEIERTNTIYISTDSNPTPSTPSPYVYDIGAYYAWIAWSSDPHASYYWFEFETAGGSYVHSQTVEAMSSPNVYVGGLSANTRYRVRVQAYGGGQWTSYSNWLYFYTSEAPKSTTPTPTLQSSAEGSLRFNYYVTTLSEYDIQLVRRYDNYVHRYSTYDSAYTFSGLQHGVGYYFIARVKSPDKEWSDWSSPLYVWTLPKTPTITTASKTSNSITINISCSGNVGGYSIYTLASTGVQLKAETFNTTSTNTSYTVTGLTAGQTYIFEVGSYHDFASSRSYSQYRSNRLTEKIGFARPQNWAWEYSITSGGSFYSQSGKVVYLMRAVHWNDFTTRINDMRKYKNLNEYVFTQAKTSTTEVGIRNCINEAINAVNDMLSTGKISNVATGSSVSASIFVNLRDKLNSIT